MLWSLWIQNQLPDPQNLIHPTRSRTRQTQSQQMGKTYPQNPTTPRWKQPGTYRSCPQRNPRLHPRKSLEETHHTSLEELFLLLPPTGTKRDWFGPWENHPHQQKREDGSRQAQERAERFGLSLSGNRVLPGNQLHRGEHSSLPGWRMRLRRYVSSLLLAETRNADVELVQHSLQDLRSRPYSSGYVDLIEKHYPKLSKTLKNFDV